MRIPIINLEVGKCLMDKLVKKKLFIVRRDSDGIGGAEKVANRFLMSFSRFYETELVHAGKTIDGFKIRGTSGPTWTKCIRFALSTRTFLLKHPTSVVLSMERGVPGTIYRAGDGVHLVWQEYKYSNNLKKIFNPMNIILPMLEKISVEKSKYVVANSNLIKLHLQNHYSELPKNKISVIYNGYDSQIFKELIESKKSDLYQKWNFSQENLNLLFSGSGWDRKGLNWCLELTRNLLQAGLPVKIWIAGLGDQKKYQEISKKLGINEKVIFLGSVKNIQELYQISDYMVLPTKYDAFSNSCLEALSCGCRVLTTTQNGASELVDESNGLVIDIKKSDAYQKAVSHLLAYAKNKPKSNFRNYENAFGNERETQQYYELLNLA